MKNKLKQLRAITIVTFLTVSFAGANASETKVLNLETGEISLQLENWMTDENMWNAGNTFLAGFANETETTLELENWMMTENIWESAIAIPTETENKLQLETWMTNNEMWK